MKHMREMNENEKRLRTFSKRRPADNRTLVLIPCFNEEATIGSIVLKARRYVDTVLVVDDGSSDSTADIAKDAGAVVLSHKENKGKSAVIKTGFKYAIANGYEFVVTMDGDGQHNPDEIPSILAEIQNNGHDVVLGMRAGAGTEMPGWRKIGKRVLDYTTSFGNGGYVTDSQCGFRAFNKKAVQGLVTRLNGDAFCLESESLIKAHDLGLKIGNTRVMCKYDGLDTSTKNPASHGFSVLNYVIWLVAERRPLLFIGLPGFALVVLGLFMGILTLQTYNQTHVFLISYAILVSILLIVGFLAMFMGLVLNVLPNIIKRSRQDAD